MSANAAKIHNFPYASHGQAISRADFQTKLNNWIHDSGVINSLKLQLRHQLVNQLRVPSASEFDKVVNSTSRSNLCSNVDHPVFKLACLSLVSEYLQKNCYDYTLSVFLPETGVQKDKVMSINEVLITFNVPKVIKDVILSDGTHHKISVLESLLDELFNRQIFAPRNVSCQTDLNPANLSSNIAEKMAALDAKFRMVSLQDQQDWMSTEDRLLRIQKELAGQSQKELTMQMKQFEDSELAKMKLEERARCQSEIEKRQKQLEEQYRLRVASLEERERSSSDRYKNQGQLLERDLYSQRQTLIRELETAQSKEYELRQRSEATEREQQLWQEKIKEKENALKERETSLRKSELEFNHRLNLEIEKNRLEEQNRYSQRYRDVEERERKLQDSERHLLDERGFVDGWKRQAQEKNLQLGEMEKELKQVRHEMMTLEKDKEIFAVKLREMVDYQHLKDERSLLKHQLDSARMQLAEAQRDLRIEREKREEYLLQGSLQSTKCNQTQLQEKLQVKLQEELNLLRTPEEETDEVWQMTDAKFHNQLERNKQLLAQHAGRGSQTNRQDKQNAEMNGAEDAARPRIVPFKTTPSHVFDDQIFAFEDFESVTSEDRYSVSSSIVEITKQRLLSLDQLAQNLEHQYKTFQANAQLGLATRDQHLQPFADKGSSVVHPAAPLPARQVTSQAPPDELRLVPLPSASNIAADGVTEEALKPKSLNELLKHTPARQSFSRQEIEKEEERSEDGDEKIDPKMREYMAMLREKREKEKNIAREAVSSWKKATEVLSDSGEEVSFSSDKAAGGSRIETGRAAHEGDDDFEW